MAGLAKLRRGGLRRYQWPLRAEQVSYVTRDFCAVPQLGTAETTILIHHRVQHAAHRLHEASVELHRRRTRQSVFVALEMNGRHTTCDSASPSKFPLQLRRRAFAVS